MNPRKVAVLGTLDTKSEEIEFLEATLSALGARVWLIDAGVLGTPGIKPGVSNVEVARAAGTTLALLRTHADRATALATMGRGAGKILAQLVADQECGAVIALGGSGGTAVATEAFDALPFGFPKVLVSTQVASSAAALAGHTDLILVSAVADLAGLNRVTRRVLATAAGAVLGAMTGPLLPDPTTAPIFATMIGLTTPGVEAARRHLESAGIEVITFHATGSGGAAMENLIGPMKVRGMLDLTTVEVADEVVGGVKSAGPDRMLPAIRGRVPQVVSTGGLDMVRFGPMSSVPEKFRDRQFHAHTAMVTLMRSNPQDNDRIGRFLGEALAQAEAPVHLVVPTRGSSALAVEGGPFHDPEADAALFSALEAHVSDRVDLIWMDTHINHPEFARRVADLLLADIEESQPA